MVLSPGPFAMTEPGFYLGEHRAVRARPKRRAGFRRRGTSKKPNKACFIVRDNSGQALAYVIFRGRARAADCGPPMTRDEARRIAGAIIRLPELLREPGEHRAVRARPKRRAGFRRRGTSKKPNKACFIVR